MIIWLTGFPWWTYMLAGCSIGAFFGFMIGALLTAGKVDEWREENMLLRVKLAMCNEHDASVLEGK